MVICKNNYFRARIPARGVINVAMRKYIGIIAVFALLLPACTKNASLNPNSAGDQEMPDPPSALQEYTAIVTVKQEADGRICFQLDDNTRLYPDNYTERFSRQCRIICALSWWAGSDVCHVIWMDYLQEGPVQDTPAEEGDGVDILDDWMTSVEDGYLTLHYSTYWGDGSVPHTLLLVSGENLSDPYELRLVHLRNGDAAQNQADALIYFDLASLPKTGKGGQTLTLKWIDSAGQTVNRKYHYRSRQ